MGKSRGRREHSKVEPGFEPRLSPETLNLTLCHILTNHPQDFLIPGSLSLAQHPQLSSHLHWSTALDNLRCGDVTQGTRSRNCCWASQATTSLFLGSVPRSGGALSLGRMGISQVGVLLLVAPPSFLTRALWSTEMWTWLEGGKFKQLESGAQVPTVSWTSPRTTFSVWLPASSISITWELDRNADLGAPLDQRLWR